MEHEPQLGQSEISTLSLNRSLEIGRTIVRYPHAINALLTTLQIEKAK